mmetsp:Transcript_15846/g.17889  ORF Transcript_15846/g.17889 Transcript_15846/m.17889 type:complete len:493 (+) Transcript_15846:431-1909(+)|eukprot:CAMPEP_0184013078 /NCGR_PEP_ID=MMETSP0954-20121128/4809_1 /TAXON_ID=627963 /ORGANISM="Aplanochytrium sp, Strain PBS07" /LENGTH=492 /DNA_ID=CAMNT_0026293219 /DNA_START=369 /DNA_END=1847 /DNA_ORIENTATION=-
MAPTVQTKKKPRFWTKEEDTYLRSAIKKFGTDSYDSWKEVAANVPNRSYRECMQRWTKVLCPGLKKGKWSPEEDAELTRLVNLQLKTAEAKEDGNKKIVWSKITKIFNGRSCKQCRERWINHLDPTVRKCEWTKEEDTKLLQLADKNPHKWAKIARFLPGRTENMVKVRWNALNRQMQKNKANATRLNNQMKQQAAMFGHGNGMVASGTPTLLNQAINESLLLNQQEQVRRASVLSFGSLLDTSFNPMAGGPRRGSFTAMPPLVQTPTDRKNSFLINSLWQDPSLEGITDPIERERRLSRRLSQIALNYYDPNNPLSGARYGVDPNGLDFKAEEKSGVPTPRGGFYLNEIDGNPDRRKSTLLLNEIMRNNAAAAVKGGPAMPMQEQPKPQLSFGRFNEKNQTEMNRRLSTLLFQNVQAGDVNLGMMSPTTASASGTKRNDYGIFEEDNKRSRKDSLMFLQKSNSKKKLKPSSYRQQLPTMAESPAETCAVAK